jgi:hypothetical protein
VKHLHMVFLHSPERMIFILHISRCDWHRPAHRLSMHQPGRLTHDIFQIQHSMSITRVGRTVPTLGGQCRVEDVWGTEAVAASAKLYLLRARVFLLLVLLRSLIRAYCVDAVSYYSDNYSARLMNCWLCWLLGPRATVSQPSPQEMEIHRRASSMGTDTCPQHNDDEREPVDKDRI